MKKKILSIALVLALCIGLAVPVGAAEQQWAEHPNDLRIYIENGTAAVYAAIMAFGAVNDERTWEITNAEYIDVETYAHPDVPGATFPVIVVDAPATITVFRGVCPMLDRGDMFFYRFETGASVVDFADAGSSFTLEEPGYYVFWTSLVTQHVGIHVRDSEDTPTLPTDPTLPDSIDTPSSWAVSYVDRANALNIVPANFNSNFTQNTTRAEFAALAVQVYETVTGSAITGRNTFDDTDDVNVQKAAYIGVVGGVGGGRFDPGGTLTREQAAAMISRLADAIGQPLPEEAADFVDGDAISGWARDYVGSMQATGIMGGVGGNRFDPQGAYTREQSIITAVRLFDIVS